mmetsp:Transcript_561/g.747  ORF Transcript_561/g.747 Transcript_561/m.747 type:complete len:868 (+) Transcript_561:62-2665(+)
MQIGAIRNGFAADESLSELQRIEKYVFHSLAITRLAYVRRIADCAKIVGRYTTQKKLIPLLDRILKDQEKDVRSALAEQLGELAAILSSETKENVERKDEKLKRERKSLTENLVKLRKNPKSRIKLTLSAKFRSKEKSCGSYLKISQQRKLLHESKIIWNTSEAEWKEFEIPLQNLDFESPVKIVCWNKKEMNQKTSEFGGTVILEVHRLVNMKSKSKLAFCDRFGAPLKQSNLNINSIDISPPLDALFDQALTESASNKRERKAITHKLIPCIQKLLIDEEQQVRDRACEALVKVASLLNETEVQTNILTVVLLLAHDENEQHKIVASKLLSSLANILGSLLCQEFCAPELLHLADDPKCGVRKAAIQSFGKVAMVAGEETTKKKLFPSFRSLSKDQVWSVRKSVVEQLVEMAEASDKKETAKMFSSMFEELAGDASRWVRNSAFEVLGRLIHTLGEDSPRSLISWFCKIPSLASTKIDQECTFFCAYNFPAVCKTVGFNRYPDLATAFEHLCKDVRFPVRRALACSLHEMSQILGPHATEEYLLEPLDKFLKDATNEVRQGVLKGLGTFLAMVKPEKRDDYLPTVWQIVRSSQRNWRFREIIAQQLVCFSRVFSKKSVEESVSGLTTFLCLDDVAVVRNAAVVAVPHVLNRLCEGGEAECKACKSFIDKITALADSKTYKERQLFVFICEAMMAIPARHTVFEKSFLSLLLKLAVDPIANVRISFTKHILPSAKESKLKGKFEEVLGKLINDKQTDVKFFLAKSGHADKKRSDGRIGLSLEMLNTVESRLKERELRLAQEVLDSKAPPAPKSLPPPEPKILKESTSQEKDSKKEEPEQDLLSKIFDEDSESAPNVEDEKGNGSPL